MQMSTYDNAPPLPDWEVPVKIHHHCGLIMPADALVCAACGEWLSPAFTD